MPKNDSEPSIFCVTVNREFTTLTNYNSTKGKCFECWFHVRTKYSIATPEMLKAGGRVEMIFRPLASSPYDFKLDQHGVVGQLTKERRMVTTHTFHCT